MPRKYETKISKMYNIHWQSENLINTNLLSFSEQKLNYKFVFGVNLNIFLDNTLHVEIKELFKETYLGKLRKLCFS